MKQIYTLLTFLSFITISQAQTTLGMRLGANLSNVNFSDYNDLIDSKFKFGPTVGVYFNIPVNKSVAIQPELLYSSQGFKTKETIHLDGLAYESEGKFKTDYITLPVLAKYKIENGMTFEVGPKLSYFYLGKYTRQIDIRNNQGIIETISDNIDLKNDTDDFKDLDFSIVGGIGYDFKFGASINVRYTYGITNFNKADDLKSRNNYFSLSVAVPFN
ncbi:PorT family protein [Empedobacter falsenii]